MIQRKQTLFLLGVILLMVASAFLPHWKEVKTATESGQKQIVELTSMEMEHRVQKAEGQMKVVEEKNTLSILVLCLAAAALSGFIIFQYHKRMLQVKLSAFNSLLIGGTAAASIWYSRQGDAWIPGDSGQFLIGIILPVVALVFNMVARYFIMKDERMVRDSERLR